MADLLEGNVKSLSKKATRDIERHMRGLFGRKAFTVPTTLEEFVASHPLMREVELSDGRIVLLSDEGMAGLRNLARAIEEGNPFDGCADYADIYAACRSTYKDCLDSGMQPTDAREFVASIVRIVGAAIDTRHFVVPVYGIELKGIHELSLGDLRIVGRTVHLLDEYGIEYDKAHFAQAVEAMGPLSWLLGESNGTERVAIEKFRQSAMVATGMLAVHVGAIYEGGAMGFRIGTIMSPEEGFGRTIGFSWSDREKKLVTQFRYVGSQQFEIDGEVSAELCGSSILQRGFRLATQEAKTDLEQAIARALYWYSDAQRDQIQVMRFVKFWTCVEVLFTLATETITKDVSIGLASMLCYGGLRFKEVADYPSVKKRATRLYGLRSRALHGGMHEKISKQDVAGFSQWVAWTIITMISLSERGYTTRAEIAAKAMELDRQADAGTAGAED